MMKLKLRKQDTVIIRTGEYKKNVGKISSIFPRTNQVYIENIFRLKKIKDNKGKVVEKNVPVLIHYSNISAYSETSHLSSRLGFSFEGEDNKKKRILMKNKEFFGKTK